MQPNDPLPGDYKPAITDNPADVLARVYALILSWPTAAEKQATREAAARGDG